MATPRCSTRISVWRVREHEENLSLHNTISFIISPGEAAVERTLNTTPGWRTTLQYTYAEVRNGGCEHEDCEPGGADEGSPETQRIPQEKVFCREKKIRILVECKDHRNEERVYQQRRITTRTNVTRLGTEEAEGNHV
ncbi:hypothetical protein GWI33_021024 [Rhynchophorus ferrugineus]|uniref:Uncharacterized protein n=1 Tax=Rhynchophorus ferrugineus TaxID=354439 RepID=A0A834HVH7_RHYFE|nr:hypothetical protein GWI33_021024 [Rhynchophorus ferrugineus]